MLEQAARQRRMESSRSTLPTELVLAGYSAVTALILLRTVFVVLDVSGRVWTGQFVYGLFEPVTNVLALIPGAERVLIWNLSMVDLTLLVPVLLFPLGMIAMSGRNAR